jgi:hypothetical protein
MINLSIDENHTCNQSKLLTTAHIKYVFMHFLSNFKDAVKSVLHISSAHNIGVPTDISIAQIFYETFLK